MTQEGLFPADLVTGADGADAPRPADGWLGEVLEAALTWRRSAVARLAPCRRCGALTLHAADMGLDLLTESTVDPRLLDRGLEIRALLAGRFTAEVEPRRHGGGPLIFRRDADLAKRVPAVRRRLWVPEHKCFDPLGHEVPLELFYPFESQQFRRSISNDNECPF